jgi:hypothetical protein
MKDHDKVPVEQKEQLQVEAVPEPARQRPTERSKRLPDDDLFPVDTGEPVG